MAKGWYGNKMGHSLASRGIKTQSDFKSLVKDGISVDDIYSNRNKEKFYDLVTFLHDNGEYIKSYPVDESQTVSNAGSGILYEVGDYFIEFIIWNQFAEEHEDEQTSLSVWKKEDVKASGMIKFKDREERLHESVSANPRDAVHSVMEYVENERYNMGETSKMGRMYDTGKHDTLLRIKNILDDEGYYTDL